MTPTRAPGKARQVREHGTAERRLHLEAGIPVDHELDEAAACRTGGGAPAARWKAVPPPPGRRDRSRQSRRGSSRTFCGMKLRNRRICSKLSSSLSTALSTVPAISTATLYPPRPFFIDVLAKTTLRDRGPRHEHVTRPFDHHREMGEHGPARPARPRPSPAPRR